MFLYVPVNIILLDLIELTQKLAYVFRRTNITIPTIMHDILRLSTDVLFASHPVLRVQAPAECDHTCAERGEAASRPRRMGRRVHGSHHQMLGKSISTKLCDTFFFEFSFF